MAVVATPKLRPLPFYFPPKFTNRSQYVNGSSPRVYKVADEDGKNHKAYRIVVSTGENGEYWGVQGMAWKNPPILASPDRVRRQNGRDLLLFYDGSRLRMVAWKTTRGAYYIANTASRRLTNARMLAIAGSLTRLKS
jgi:hypothetical protein